MTKNISLKIVIILVIFLAGFLGFVSETNAYSNIASGKGFFSSEPNPYDWFGLTDGHIVTDANQEGAYSDYTYATGASGNFPKWVIIDLEGSYDIDSVRLFKEFGPSCVVGGQQNCSYNDPNSCSTNRNNTKTIQVQSRTGSGAWTNWGNYTFPSSAGGSHNWTRPSKIRATEIKITFLDTYAQWRQSSPCICANCGKYLFLREAQVWGDPPSCPLPWGGTLASGTSVDAYQASSVACGSSCASQTRTCTNGVLSGTYTNQNCSVAACAAATLTFGNNATITRGGNATLTWSTTNVSGNCTASGTSNWSGGKGTSGSQTLNFPTAGTFQHNLLCYNSANVPVSKTVTIQVNAPVACALPWGGTLASGSSTDAFSASSVACGGNCNSVKQTRTCNNGTLSGTYTNQNCSVAACNAPTFNFTGNPLTITPPGSSTLSWNTVQNATYCWAWSDQTDPGWRDGVGGKSLSGGTFSVTPGSSNRYYLECGSSVTGLSTTKNVSITVSCSPSYTYACTHTGASCNLPADCGLTLTDTAICTQNNSCAGFTSVPLSNCSGCSDTLVPCGACSTSGENWKEVAP